VIVAADNSKWRVVPRPKPKSRADRRDDAVSELRTIYDELERIKGELEGLESEEDLLEDVQNETDIVKKADFLCKLEESKKQWGEFIDEAQVFVDGVDTSEVESLLEELQQWMDSMTGTNLESTGKYQMLDEAVSSLQEAVDSLNSMPNIEDVDSIEEAVNTLDEVVSNLESVEFPGMFS
jgi:prefoldin subunit 5